jgi:uncharacterized protein
MTRATLKQREVLLDGLRAAALFGVLVVNGLGYVDAPNQIPIGLPRPEDSFIAYGIHWLVFVFLQGKAYPLLSLLVGYSMVLSWRKFSQGALSDALATRRSRDWRMLALGILHGSLIYFGDILTLYAIAGLIAAPWLRASSKVLRKKWCLFLKINIWINVLLTALLLVSSQAPASQIEKIVSFHGDLTWIEFLGRNFEAYLSQQFLGSITMLPLLIWLMLSGMLAARMRLLGDARRANAWVQARWSKLGLCIALLTNICSATLVLWDPKAASLAGKLGLSMMTPAGVFLMFYLLAGAIVLQRQKLGLFQRALIFLAPAGRYTLTMYVMCSVSLFLTSGVVFNWPASSLQFVLLMFLLYLLCIFAARQADALNLRGPLETWLSGKRR